MSVASVVCCQVEVFATGRSLVQRSPTDCSVILCDLESSEIRRLWPPLGCCTRGMKKIKCYEIAASVMCNLIWEWSLWSPQQVDLYLEKWSQNEVYTNVIDYKLTQTTWRTYYLKTKRKSEDWKGLKHLIWQPGSLRLLLHCFCSVLALDCA
jgi:hypothetical protein